jgi:sucrose phosphorylase
MDRVDDIKHLLGRIYGPHVAEMLLKRILALLKKYKTRAAHKKSYFSQRDIVLITYGDSLQKSGEAPLSTLHGFARQHLKDAISHIHFLPFFPYSSDDGFSVMDFYEIDSQLGTWDDVASIGQDFDLMFDYVVNHFSSQGQWFDSYLKDQEGFSDFAIEVDPAEDLSKVTRPRSLPLLSAYTKANGQTVHLWTTFSADQIDFNFKSPDVLATMLDVLLFYVDRGATILRLDAIAYLWKQIGTTCIHLEQTHAVVKLFRAVLDMVAPDVILLTETNVPHDENISYFGNGRDEAQMVYNFTLPPLLLYSMVKQDATVLSQWAQGLGVASAHNTFFNFTASHDGIGVRPLEGILAPAELDALIELVNANGGQVSYKNNPDGSSSPYELNITYVDAILADEDNTRAEKFLASQSIQLALPGVPAIYIHSLLGSRNWLEGVEQTGRARTINREKLNVETLLAELNDPSSFRARIFFAYRHLIKTRRRQSAFHPNAEFQILPLAPKVFAIKRTSEDQTIYALTNIAGAAINVSLRDAAAGQPLTDLISGQAVNPASIDLQAYQYLWLAAANNQE